MRRWRRETMTTVSLQCKESCGIALEGSPVERTRGDNQLGDSAGPVFPLLGGCVARPWLVSEATHVLEIADVPEGLAPVAAVVSQRQ